MKMVFTGAKQLSMSLSFTIGENGKINPIKFDISTLTLDLNTENEPNNNNIKNDSTNKGNKYDTTYIRIDGGDDTPSTPCMVVTRRIVSQNFIQNFF